MINLIRKALKKPDKTGIDILLLLNKFEPEGFKSSLKMALKKTPVKFKLPELKPKKENGDLSTNTASLSQELKSELLCLRPELKFKRHDKEFVCARCNREFWTSRELTAHLLDYKHEEE